jgi:hypothetical protein
MPNRGVRLLSCPLSRRGRSLTFLLSSHIVERQRMNAEWGRPGMGASFRNAGEIEALAGCHRLTITPTLLDAASRRQRLSQAMEARDDPAFGQNHKPANPIETFDDFNVEMR